MRSHTQTQTHKLTSVTWGAFHCTEVFHVQFQLFLLGVPPPECQKEVARVGLRWFYQLWIIHRLVQKRFWRVRCDNQVQENSASLLARKARSGKAFRVTSPGTHPGAESPSTGWQQALPKRCQSCSGGGTGMVCPGAPCPVTVLGSWLLSRVRPRV